MRILVVTPYYPPEGGGLERYAHALTQGLQGRGHEARVLTFRRNGATYPPQMDVHAVEPWLCLGNTPIHPRFSRFVDHHIASWRPDVVWAHTPVPFPAEMAFRAAQRNRVPFVLTYHAGRLRGSSAPLDWAARIDHATFERSMVLGAERVVAVTPYVARVALAQRVGDVDVLPPGVDVERFRPRSEAAQPGSVLFVGPLDRKYAWKGLDTLLEAVQLVRRRRPVHLRLVGEGDRLQELSVHVGVRDGWLELLGRLDEEALAREYASNTVTVLPSLTDAESFGMVLAEANACGRPVVASRVGGIPDFVENGVNGRLAPPGDACALADVLEQVLDHPQEADAMGRRGRERVEAGHDWRTLTPRMERILEGAASL